MDASEPFLGSLRNHNGYLSLSLSQETMQKKRRNYNDVAVNQNVVSYPPII
jgi:hypothetical protein